MRSPSQWWPAGRHPVTLLVLVVLVIVAVGAGASLAYTQRPRPVSEQPGQWSSVQVWPVEAVHASLLPTGQVLVFDTPDATMFTWDPASGATASLSGPGFNVYCSGHALLADGRLFLAGGHVVNYVGLPNASVYDPLAGEWSSLAPMASSRWYPTSTVLANGDVLVTAGTILPGVDNSLPEVWQAEDGAWRALDSAQQALPTYPWMFLAPNGKVFFAGPLPFTQYLDTSGAGTWTDVARTTGGWRSFGSAAMYGDGKVLIAGGGNPATAVAEVIDLTAASPAWRQVAPMAYPRRQHNLTLLPDGTVLATGGSSASSDDEATQPVLAAELWDPESETWSTLASSATYRGYHSIAMLLPDGRVLSAGGTGSGTTAELFSPPYLFRGARPSMSSAPPFVQYGESFHVETPDAARIAKVTMVRLSSVTHAFDQNQRINRLDFTAASGGLDVSAPSDPNLSPPGHYMLFLLDNDGVPSVASMIRLDVTQPTS
jgi:galactose oxidase